MTNLEHLTIPAVPADLFEVETSTDGAVHLRLDPITAGQLGEAWWRCHTNGDLGGRDLHTALEQTARLVSHAGQAAHDQGLLDAPELVPSTIARHTPGQVTR